MGIAGTEQPVCLVSLQNKLSLSCDFIDNLDKTVVCVFNHFVSPGLTLSYWLAKHFCFSMLFRKIKFGNNSSSQYLISITNQYLTVWNLLSCTGLLEVIVFLKQLVFEHLSVRFTSSTYLIFSSIDYRKGVLEVVR